MRENNSLEDLFLGIFYYLPKEVEFFKRDIGRFTQFFLGMADKYPSLVQRCFDEEEISHTLFHMHRDYIQSELPGNGVTNYILRKQCIRKHFENMLKKRQVTKEEAIGLLTLAQDFYNNFLAIKDI